MVRQEVVEGFYRRKREKERRERKALDSAAKMAAEGGNNEAKSDEGCSGPTSEFNF